MSDNETIVTEDAELDTEGHLPRKVIDNETVVDGLRRLEPDTDGSDEDPRCRACGERVADVGDGSAPPMKDGAFWPRLPS